MRRRALLGIKNIIQHNPIYHFPLITDANDIIQNIVPNSMENLPSFSSGEGAKFNGTTNRIEYENIFYGLTEWTIYAEVYPTQSTNYRGFFGTMLLPLVTNGFKLDFWDGLYITHNTDLGSENERLAIATIPLNQWSTIVWSIKNGELSSIWVNNIKKIDVFLVGNILNGSNYIFRIGNIYTRYSAERAFIGMQRNIKIYDSYLTPNDLN